MFPTLSVARTECRLQFGREYLIPKPFDPRVLMWEASAVAEAAMQTGAAQEPVDLDTYRAELERRLGKAYQVSRAMIHKAQVNPKQVVFPEGENEKILRACHMLAEERIGNPILLGDAEKIRTRVSLAWTWPEWRLSIRLPPNTGKPTFWSSFVCGSGGV